VTVIEFNKYSSSFIAIHEDKQVMHLAFKSQAEACIKAMVAGQPVPVGVVVPYSVEAWGRPVDIVRRY